MVHTMGNQMIDLLTQPLYRKSRGPETYNQDMFSHDHGDIATALYSSGIN